MRTLGFAGLFMLSFVLAGCGTLLDADFEDYSVGELFPNGSLPGDPIGDEIISAGNAVVSVAKFDWKDTKWLQIAGAPIAGAQIVFIPRDPMTMPTNYYFSFTGVLGMDPPQENLHPDVIIQFRQLNPFKEFCKIEFKDREIFIFTGEFTHDNHGLFEVGVNHTVFVRLDVENRLCFVEIKQFSSDNPPTLHDHILVNGQPFTNPDAIRLDQVQFGVIWSEDEEEEQAIYLIDDVKITTDVRF